MSKEDIVRIGNYGIAHDGLQWILTTYGTKERFLKPGETPREVLKSTSYFSSIENVAKKMHEIEMSDVYDKCESVNEIIAKGLANILAKLAKTGGADA